MDLATAILGLSFGNFCALGCSTFSNCCGNITWRMGCN